MIYSNITKKLFSIPLPRPILLFFISSYLKIKKPYHSKKEKNRFIFDEKGIPSRNYGLISGTNVGIQKSPVAVSQKANEYLEEFKKSGSKKSREFFINCANWLVKNTVTFDNYSILYYNFPWPIYNLEKPWCSGMAQGQAIQVLIKAHNITKSKEYLDSAKLLINSFFVETTDGGVTYKDSDDRWWFEEYASKKGKQPRVLNGMIFAMIGIFNHFNYTNDSDSKFLFYQGLRALENDLPRYDYGNGYSYYDVLKRPARKYHSVHVDQMKQLFDITNKKIFSEYYDRWKNYDFFKNLPSLILEEIRINRTQ